MLAAIAIWRPAGNTVCGNSAVALPIALAAGQIAVFQGTPLLLQLFVVYYGLGLIGLKLSAWAAVAVGFTLNASAVRGEIWCS